MKVLSHGLPLHTALTASNYEVRKYCHTARAEKWCGEGLWPTGSICLRSWFGGARGTQKLVLVQSSKSFLKFSLPTESRTHFYWGGVWPSCTDIIYLICTQIWCECTLCVRVFLFTAKKNEQPMRWLCCCLNTCSWSLVQSNSTCLVYCKGIIV